MACQRLDGLFLKLGKLHPGRDRHVGGDNTRTPGVGDNGESISVGHLSAEFSQRAFVFVGKSAGEIEQFVDGVDPDDAGLFKDGIIDRFGARQGPRVRSGRLSAGAGPSGLDGKHRCGPVITRGDLFDHFDEFGTPPQLFHVYQDNFRIRVFVKVSQQIQFIDIGLVSDGYKFRKPELLIRGKIENRGTERTALGHKRNISSSRHACRKTGVEPHGRKRIDNAQAVGTHNPDVCLLADGDDPVFDFKPFLADFTKTGRDDHDPFDPFFNGVFHSFQRRIRRKNNHCKIHCIGNIAD